jgi:hypothetical protein
MSISSGRFLQSCRRFVARKPVAPPVLLPIPPYSLTSRSASVFPVFISLCYAPYKMAATECLLSFFSSAKTCLSSCYTLCPQSTVLLSVSASRTTPGTSPHLSFAASFHTGRVLFLFFVRYEQRLRTLPAASRALNRSFCQMLA